MSNGFPYFTVPPLELSFLPNPIGDGPFALQPFGLLVATGVIVGAKMVYRRTERLGMDLDHARGMVFWACVCGFIGAHVLDVIFYQREALARDPLLLIKLWAGISSYGGFVGGTLGVLGYLHHHKLSLRRYGDTAIYGLTLGFTFGRLGCTVVHDHIGAPSDGFFLATNYTAEVIAAHNYRLPEAGLYHNLGMYEFLFLLPLCVAMLLFDRRPRPPGFFLAFIVMCYAPVRFLMDGLRLSQTDPRYVGLTFAQWMSVVAFVLGVGLLLRLRKSPATAEAPAAPAKSAASAASKVPAKAASSGKAAAPGKAAASQPDKKPATTAAKKNKRGSKARKKR